METPSLSELGRRLTICSNNSQMNTLLFCRIKFQQLYCHKTPQCCYICNNDVYDLIYVLPSLVRVKEK